MSSGAKGNDRWRAARPGDTLAPVTDLTETTLPRSVAGENDDSSLAAFYRGMTVPERRTMLACALGYALDGLDFTIFTLVLGSVISYWHVDRGSAGLTVSATLLCSAVG